MGCWNFSISYGRVKKTEVPTEARLCLAALADQVDLLKQRILAMDRQILKWHRANDLSRKLEGIPGVGPLVATALAASIPDPGVFRSGRDLSAWIGLVPKQNSSGGKEKLGGISKAGNRYLRQLLVLGALAVIKRAKLLGHARHPWLVGLMERRPSKIAAVALANKMARVAWAMMSRNEPYRVTPVAAGN
jgi:transposase